MQRLFFFFVFIQGFWFKQGPHDGYDTQVWLDITRIKDGLYMYRTGFTLWYGLDGSKSSIRFYH